ncbi:hypothetical protein DPMN_015083 [Dreissena polymorpha]|uniref:Uncharacterized protein n=1 Tax=Dreissena polymorpha TaxID=45954 RepID=A0A9D4N753_DREPO|nr:hypothetical protein DPMN_015083 [Dreissena polymorpha]
MMTLEPLVALLIRLPEPLSRDSMLCKRDVPGLSPGLAAHFSPTGDNCAKTEYPSSCLSVVSLADSSISCVSRRLVSLLCLSPTRKSVVSLANSSNFQDMAPDTKVPDGRTDGRLAGRTDGQRQNNIPPPLAGDNYA